MNKNIKYVIGVIGLLILIMALILVSSKKAPVEQVPASLTTDETIATVPTAAPKSGIKKPSVVPQEVPSTTSGSSSISGDWTWQYTIMANGTKKSAPNNEKFVLSFLKNKTVTSTTDCNNLTSTYNLKQDSIIFEPFVSTKKFCTGSFEVQYTQQLAQVASYRIIGDELQLHLAKDAGTMFFVLKYKDLSPTSTNTLLKINNTAYRLVSYNGESIPDSVDYTLSFKDGVVNAKFCNAMSGQYSLDGHTIKAAMVSTLMYCQSPANLMDIETSFSSIGSGVTINQDGVKLTLTTPTNDTLVFISVVE